MTKCAFFQTIILFLLERWMGEVNITYAQALAQLTREPALQRGEVHLQYKMKQPTQAFELLLRLLHNICYHCQLPQYPSLPFPGLHNATNHYFFHSVKILENKKHKQVALQHDCFRTFIFLLRCLSCNSTRKLSKSPNAAYYNMSTSQKHYMSK